MYHEEEIINGVLSFRNDPNGEWTAFTLEEMTKKWEKQRQEFAAAKAVDLHRLVRHFWCWVVGHRPELNGQQYENVTVHGIDGTTRIERRLVEREWCSRCRSEISVSLPNDKVRHPASE